LFNLDPEFQLMQFQASANYNQIVAAPFEVCGCAEPNLLPRSLQF